MPNRPPDHRHFIIDGRGYTSVKTVYHAALERGTDLTYDVFRKRLRRGVTTWDELLKRKAGGKGLRDYWSRSKDEMHDICAAIDARKKALAESNHEE